MKGRDARMRGFTDAGIRSRTSFALTGASSAMPSYEELEGEVRQQRVEIATLTYALRHIYTRVVAAREAFSDDVLELMGYKRKEE